MKLFACLLLSVALSNVSSAQGRMNMGRKNLTAATTRVKDFFVPSAGRYSGLQNVVAGLAIVGIACMGLNLNGCTVKYKEEDRQAIQAWQNLLIVTGVLGTITLASLAPRETEPWERIEDHRIGVWTTRFNPAYIVIPVTTTIGGIMWNKSTLYVSPNGTTKTAQEQLQQQATYAINSQTDRDVRTYLREHLTPATYRHVFANPAHRDGWIAVPTNAELFADKKDPLAGVVTSLEQANTIYYGYMTDPAVFTLDALKHKGENNPR